MSKNIKNNTSDALLEINSIKEALKTESRDILKNMLSESVKDYLRESIEDDEEEKEDEYDVIEGSTQDDAVESADDKDEKSEEDVEETESESEEESQEAPEDGEGEESDDDWSDYSQYQTGDEYTYDLTGEKDYNQIVKVYKLLQGDDEVVVKKEDNKIQLKDNETGTEYVIDLQDDSEEEPLDVEDGEEMAESCIKEDFDIAGFDDDELDDDEISEDDWDEEEFENKPRFENKKGSKVMKENKQIMFEVDLGYTDNYQKKDAIEGLSMEEPSKSGKSWEKGVPTGTEKPWAGDSKSKGKPFGESVNEEENVDECGMVPAQPVEEEKVCEGPARVIAKKTRRVKSATNNGNPQVGTTRKPNSDNGVPSSEEIIESYKKEIARLKKVNESYKNENVKLKNYAKELGKTIKESYVVNTNLAKITRLFTENTVSQKERIDIVNRFTNEAKTVEQSNALYETISKELKKNVKQITLENTSNVMKGEQKQNLNENVKSQMLLNTLDLIKRVDNI